MRRAHTAGQSIVEVLIAIAISAVLLAAGTALLAPAIQENGQAARIQAMTTLGNGLMGNMQAWANGNWNALLSLATTSANTYYLNTSSSPFTAVAASSGESIALGGTTYNRYFYLTDAYRDSGGSATTTAAGNTFDPSTKQITVIVSASSTASAPIVLTAYLTRNTSNVFAQSDWSGGSGQSRSVRVVGNTFTTSTAMKVSTPGAITLSFLDNVGWSTSQEPLPLTDYQFAAAAYNGYLYAVGGWVGTSTGPDNVVYYDQLNSDCTLNDFKTSLTALPINVYQDAGTAYNNYLYVIGGYNGITHTSTPNVYYTPLASGVPGAWTTSANQLPAPLGQHTAAAYNGYLYVMGGEANGGVGTSSVIYAALNATGSVGTWTTSPNQLPAGISWASGIANNGYLYVIGGDANSGGPTSSVFYATLNADGSVGTWTTSPNRLPMPIEETAAGVINGKLYVMGGWNGSAATSSVFYAVLNADGSLGTWATMSSQMPATDYSHGGAAQNGCLYSYGGQADGSPTSSVFYDLVFNATGTLDSAAFDTGVALGTQLNSVVWQGTLPTASTSVGFQFAVSNCANGATNPPACDFGTWTYYGLNGDSASWFTGPPGTPISLKTTTSGYTLFTGYRYFRYRVELVADPSGQYGPTVNTISVNWSP